MTAETNILDDREREEQEERERQIGTRYFATHPDLLSLQRGVVAATERAKAAEAQRDALAALVHRTVNFMGSAPFSGSGYGPTTLYVRRIYDLLKTAPAVSLARHDAEVKAQALDEAKQIVTNVCRDVLSDYYGQVRVEVNANLDSRAAEIRAEAE